MQSLQTQTNLKPAPSADDCARHVLNVMPPVVREIRGLMRSHRLAGLSVPQFRALTLLNLSPKASLSCVADYLGCSLPAASRMMSGLVQRKLVVRHVCDCDRRQVELRLTPMGRSAFLRARDETQKRLSDRLGSLSEPRQQLVIQAMQLLADIFGTDAVSLNHTSLNHKGQP